MVCEALTFVTDFLQTAPPVWVRVQTTLPASPDKQQNNEQELWRTV